MTHPSPTIRRLRRDRALVSVLWVVNGILIALLLGGVGTLLGRWLAVTP